VTLRGGTQVRDKKRLRSCFGNLDFSRSDGNRALQRTTLLIRPEVNSGSVLIRLGEGFDYVTVNAPATEVGEPFTRD
jgi:hypothetical protein